MWTIQVAIRGTGLRVRGWSPIHTHNRSALACMCSCNEKWIMAALSFGNNFRHCHTLRRYAVCCVCTCVRACACVHASMRSLRFAARLIRTCCAERRRHPCAFVRIVSVSALDRLPQAGDFVDSSTRISSLSFGRQVTAQTPPIGINK